MTPDELAFARMVERGLADAENGRTISHEEMKERISSWPIKADDSR
ncbi:MAG: hypothetical protein ACJ76N_15545 [Thermoanaerobaculia bacterium]